MHISNLRISGFRGLELDLPLSGPLALLVGANNAGKTAAIDALRTILLPYSGRNGDKWISTSDFTTDTPSTPGAEEIEITISISETPLDQRGNLVSALAPSLGEGCAKITLKATVGEDGRIRQRFSGGDNQNGDLESLAREAIRFVYLPPLRDAAGDLRPGSTNRLPALVSTHAPVGHVDRETLISIVERANGELRQVPAIESSTAAIRERLLGMTGSGPFAHHTDLSFSAAEYERIVATLQALAGNPDLAGLHQNGLGFNNLVYMAVLLAALQDDDSSSLNVLLIEEPEAHLHPQLQSLLMAYLESVGHERTQVIATTHSPHFASVARLDRTTVLHRQEPNVSPTAHALKSIGIPERNAAYLRRFLDVTKAGLLFSRGTVLVEGIAEQLLLPVMAEHLERSFNQAGVAIINIGGVAFAPFLDLFGPDGLPFRCCIISDSDPRSDANGLISRSPLAEKLFSAASEKVLVFLAQNTLEWDMALANRATPKALIESLRDIHPRLASSIETNLSSPTYTAENFADEFLSAISNDKGRFAQGLAYHLGLPGVDFTIPQYLKQAILEMTVAE